MKNTLETRLGMFVALALVASFLILEILGGRDFLKPGYHLRAQFANAQDLKVGDAVKIAGVPVGRVEKIELADSKVEVLMKLDKSTIVHTDSKATIKFTGLMGQYYVGVDFGSPTAPQAVDGALLTSTEQPDLSALMAKLDDVASGVQNLTRSFSGDKIDNILGPFTDFMKNNNQTISAIITNVQGISAQIRAGQGSIGKLVYDDSLYNSASATILTLQGTAAEIKQTVAKAETVVDQINAGQGTAGMLVKDPALYTETTATMKNIKEISGKINSGDGTVGKLVNDQELYKNVKLTVQKVDKAMESLEDTGPLSIFGQVVTSLF